MVVWGGGHCTGAKKENHVYSCGHTLYGYSSVGRALWDSGIALEWDGGIALEWDGGIAQWV